MKQTDFEQYAKQGFNHIPIAQEILADLETPLSVYLKLANRPFSYLFESVQGGEKSGRYSIIGLQSDTIISVRQQQISVNHNGQQQAFSDNDPLNWIDNYLSNYRSPPLLDLPRFSGGLVGYFGYDIVRYIEPKLADFPDKDPLQTPDILLMVSNDVVVFDNLLDRLFIITHANPDEEQAYDKAQQRLEQYQAQLSQPLSQPASIPKQSNISEQDFISQFTQQGYIDAVHRAKDYIREGDIMQVVLSQRLAKPFTADPIDLYRALRTLNPSPYLYYIKLADHHVIGASPEILVRMEKDEVTVRPIAGTRPRGKTQQHDQQLERELLADPKERAEHVMLIDLGRNDIGKISQVGTVQLTANMQIERYSQVMHIVSNVKGQPVEDISCIDALKATFPAGTVSGAAKVRAMEIIDELEPVKRGIYAGAIGYLSWTGTIDTAIAIRTAIVKDNMLYIQAGAGIVYDSDPEMEWQETLNKARAIFNAAAIAEAGLNISSPHQSSQQ